MSDAKNAYLDMELLRFTTAGSVDDGKSTLIGRLLFDSKAIFEDQMESVEQASLGRGDEEVNLALLTDGLRAERDQGITIDVAYRYFATPKRKFIIADTPGHVQYTRNMVTGASTANAAVILIDARNGVIEQTSRHSYIASLLQIPHLVICINKMDLVEYSQEIYDKIKKEYSELSAKLNLTDIRFVPISAKLGDNVVERSKNMQWYEGPTFLYLMENLHIASDDNLEDCRFPVQHVVRPQSDKYHDYRGYAGRIAGGVFRKGDSVRTLPSGMTSKIKSIDTFKKSLDYAFAPQSVSIQLEDDIDISRGDMIVRADQEIQVGQEIEMMLCWFNDKQNLIPRGKYALKHTTADARCIIQSIDYKVNINTLEKNTEDKKIQLNDIAKVTIKTTKPLFYDSYKRNRITGSIVLIDEGTNNTVAAGMII